VNTYTQTVRNHWINTRRLVNKFTKTWWDPLWQWVFVYSIHYSRFAACYINVHWIYSSSSTFLQKNTCPSARILFQLIKKSRYTFRQTRDFCFWKSKILWERISHLTMMSDFSKWPRLLYQCYFFCFVMTVTGNKKILPTSPRKVMCDLPSLSWTFTLHYFCTYCMLHLVT